MGKEFQGKNSSYKIMLNLCSKEPEEEFMIYLKCKPAH